VGIYAHGATRYQIVDNVVERTQADGIHNTFGSTDGLVAGNVVRATGDDCVAVVSYVRDGALTARTTIRDNECYEGAARGIAVVGGEDVVITGNHVEATRAAGIYFAGEPSFDTYGVDRVQVVGNEVVGANTDPDLFHGAIFAWARPGTAQAGLATVDLQVEDVLIDGNTIRDTASGHPAFVITNGHVRRFVVRNTTITGGDGLFWLALDPSDYALEGNTWNGEPIADEVGARSALSTGWPPPA
jgi:hypothetical protein